MNSKSENFLAAVERVLGAEAAEKVGRMLGGRAIFLPAYEKLTPHSALARCLGIEAARQLLKEIGNAKLSEKRVDVPLGNNGINRQVAERQDIMRLMLAEGCTTGQVASAVGCTRRHVFRFKANERADAKRSKTLTKRKVAKARQLLIAGRSVAEISEETNLPKIVVLHHKRELIKEGKIKC